MNGYPLSFTEIASWSATNGLPVNEGRVRFAQYGVLTAIARSRTLRELLVFKGGNALDFIWLPNRSTIDLDFSIDVSMNIHDLNTQTLHNRLQQALDVAGRALNTRYVVHRVRQQPAGEDKTFITYDVRIGYALQDQRRLIQRIESGEPSTQSLSIDISINEVVCADESVMIDDRRSLRASTIEDIVSEKLRALLQQSSRNRTRPQDLLDIVVCLQSPRGDALDRAKVAAFLIQKSAARGINVSHKAFSDSELQLRARIDYDALQTTARVTFVPFDEAMALLVGFVKTLDIPEG